VIIKINHYVKNTPESSQFILAIVEDTLELKALILLKIINI